MNTDFIDLDGINPPKELTINFKFVKAYCKTFQLKVTTLNFNTPKYDIFINCYDSKKKYVFGFSFHSRDNTQPSKVDLLLMEDL